MATGDQNDILNRLQRLIPNGWFNAGQVPLRDAILTGFANMFAFIYNLLAYVRLQTRIATATDGFLDLIAYDFFALNLTRALGQTDASFRQSIIAFLFRQRCTREAVILVIQQLLGVTPTVIEYDRCADTGAYSEPTTMGYGVAGVYGSMSMPLGAFIDIAVPSQPIAPADVAGYGVSVGAYSTGSLLEYIANQEGPNPVTAANIYAALNSVRPVTGQFWVNLNGYTG